MKAWLLAGCLLGALLCACNEQQPPAQPGSFDRPTRVAFACFDLSTPSAPVVAALETCDLANPDSVNREGAVTHALHALVVQSSRGEVAAVDLLNRQTLDSRRDVPGYTFLPVGELPTAIVVPATEAHAKFTYVANSGSRDITVLKTQAFRELGAKESPTEQTLQLPGGARDVPYDMVLSPDEDALFVSMPQTGRLLRVPIRRCAEPADAKPAPCPEGGLLDSSGITEIPLRDSVARSAMDASPDVPLEGYAKLCSFTGPISNASLPLPPLPADAADAQPQPTGMAVDNFCEKDKEGNKLKPCRERLLIADEALPLIHVVDFAAAGSGSDAVQIPIRSGVPTTAVAVTPRVPVDRSAESAETQYVYAIDATDGSVLVTENGRLLDVGAGGARADRVSLGGGSTLPIAMSISVFTPAFNVRGGANQHSERFGSGGTEPAPNEGNFCTDTAHTIRSNLRLRGVFLAVGAADGSVRVIDIYDMDLAECRSCDKYLTGCTECGDTGNNRCEECADQNWDPYPVVRHRPRIAVTADRNVDTQRLAPIAVPRFVTNTSVVSVRVTGTTSDPLIKGLRCLTCGEGQVPAFPDDSVDNSATEITTDGATSSSCNSRVGQTLVCVQNDPWTVVDDWIAVHQGVLPGSRGGEASLVESDGSYTLQADGQFCELGVLGADALQGKAGDRLDVVGPLPPDSAIAETEPHARDPRSAAAGRAFESEVIAACKRLVSERDNSDLPVPIAFPIRAAYTDRLELASNLVARPTGLPREFDNDAQFVNKCFGGMPLIYEVRAGSGYLVLSRNDSRFSHDVRAKDGHCVPDESLGPTFTARAYDDSPFDNGAVKFQLRGGGAAPKIDTTLVLGLATATPKTVMNSSVSVNQQVLASLPVDLSWSDIDDTLYMVDIASRGLLPIVMDPWPISGVSRSFQ